MTVKIKFKEKKSVRKKIKKMNIIKFNEKKSVRKKIKEDKDKKDYA